MRLRACFVELKVEVLLYALGHEKDLRYRPFGRRMGLSTRSPTRTAQDREDACPRLARRLRRHLLRLEERLPMADVARRLPALVYRLLPLGGCVGIGASRQGLRAEGADQ